jgi:ApaG protein
MFLLMLTEITSGIRISVEPRYEPAVSSPLLDSFVFSYHITIENQSDKPVRLLRRHWFIFDSCATKREVEGPGVVGETPLIQPGEFYRYNSACDLRSYRGTMEGYYTMQHEGEKSLLKVKVPQFKLEVPYALN